MLPANQATKNRKSEIEHPRSSAADGLDEVDFGFFGDFGEEAAGGDCGADHHGEPRPQAIAVDQTRLQSGKPRLKFGDDVTHRPAVNRQLRSAAGQLS